MTKSQCMNMNIPIFSDWFMNPNSDSFYPFKYG